MKFISKRLMILIPVFAVTMLAALLTVDSLLARPAGAPASREAPVVSATPTPSPSVAPTPVPSPAPVVSTAPAPRPTNPVVKSGDRLIIPLIGLDAPIVSVGVTPENAIDVPAGMKVGYWTGGSRPGAPGATFLDGHVDGIFAHLHKLAAGQTFQVSYGGQTYRYQVVHVETVALQGIDMNRTLRVYGDAVEGINIMTCAGTYVPSMNTYDQRLVVYSVRI